MELGHVVFGLDLVSVLVVVGIIPESVNQFFINFQGFVAGTCSEVKYGETIYDCHTASTPTVVNKIRLVKIRSLKNNTIHKNESSWCGSMVVARIPSFGQCGNINDP